MSGANLGAVAAYAMEVHADQADQSGAPYVGHLMRVWHNVWQQEGTIEQQMAALMHDTLEDHFPKVTRQTMLDRGLPENVVRIVELLTRRDDLSDDEYYARIAADDDALTVKLADIADNADPARLAKLDFVKRRRLESKYKHAREMLSQRVDADPSSVPQ